LHNPTGMRVGFVVPSFRHDADTALQAAVAAEKAGIDGVFVYDHLFPMGQPERPAISCFPLLGAAAATTERIAIGSLVARVALVPDAVLVNQFKTLARIAPGRVIAGLGTGAGKSRPEHEAYGLSFPPVGPRLESMRRVASALLDFGIEVWTSGNSPAAQTVAADLGTPHNFWAVSPEAVSTSALTVTWAGPPPAAPDDLAGHLAALREAGATWAVFAPPPSTDWPKMVGKLAGAMQAAQ